MKISAWTIYIVAICLAVSILAFALFNQAMPKYKEAEYQRTYKEQLEAEANKLSQAKKRVAVATAEVDKVAAAWNTVVEKKTPTDRLETGGINLAVNPYQLSIDTYKFRNSIQRAVNEQCKAGGVKVINGPSVRFPADSNTVGGVLADFYNFQTFGFPVVIFDFGTITVQGTYEQILENVRSYKNMKGYLAVTDSLRLEGTNVLTGTYSLSIVGFVRGDKIFPPAPEAAGATAAGGSPFGGAGGRFPGGGPPAGFGGSGGIGAGGPRAAAAGGGGGGGRDD